MNFQMRFNGRAINYHSHDLSDMGFQARRRGGSEEFESTEARMLKNKTKTKSK